MYSLLMPFKNILTSKEPLCCVYFPWNIVILHTHNPCVNYTLILDRFPLCVGENERLLSPGFPVITGNRGNSLVHSFTVFGF